jgi:outer membrane cobalamin receptor
MKIASIFALLLWLINWAAFAQGSLDSIIVLPGVDVQANRMFQKETAGMAQTTIDSMVLQHKVNSSLSELLGENTPVFIKSHGRGALATASFRGTAPSHTQVTWNGININSPMAGMVDFSLIPVYILDNVSLKHGTASIADNSGGLGGSINISNQPDWDNSFTAGYMQGIGNFGTWDEFLKLGLGNRKIQWRSRLYHNRSENNYTFLNKTIASLENGKLVNPIDTNRNAGWERYGMLHEFYLQPLSNQLISAKWWSQAADRNIPNVTSYEGPLNANLNNQIDRDHRFVADWSRHTTRSSIVVRSGYSHKNLDYFLRNQVAGLGLVPAIFSESKQQSFYNQLGYNYVFSNLLSIESNMQVNWHSVASRDSVSKLGYETDRLDYSLFFAINQRFSDRLNVKTMFRQDWTGAVRSPFIPYVGFDFLLVPGQELLLKGNIARNYKHPSLNDLYWQPGGNPRLLPEEGISIETGLQYRIKQNGTTFQAHATLFRSDINNWIIWIPSFKGYWEPQNISRVLSQGLEANTDIRSSIGSINYRISATYAFTSAKNRGDTLVWGGSSYGKQLVYIPVHSGNALFHFEYRGFEMAWQHNSYSERFTTTTNDTSRRMWLYPYFMNDLSLGKSLTFRRFNMATELKVYNLFNERYRSVLHRPMPGRNFMLLIRLSV